MISIYLCMLIYVGAPILSTLYKINYPSRFGQNLLSVVKLTNYKIQDLVSLDKVKTDFELEISDDDLNLLNSDLPKSGFEYKTATLQAFNKKYNVKVRFRGDMWNHWGLPRKSWRVKISDNQLFKGNDKFNLIIPKFEEQINNHFSYLLAKKMGLLAPESFITNLSVNDEYSGTKLYVEQLNNHFLEKNNKINSYLYKGENMRSENVAGIPFIDIFSSAYYWKNMAQKEEGYDVLKNVLYELDRLDFEKLDVDQFAKYSAYMSLINTYHVDNIHNWVLLYDNNFSKCEPVVWDPVGWGFNYSPNSFIVMSKIYENLYRDIDFMREKQVWLNHFFEIEEQAFIEQIEKEKENIKQKIGVNDYHFSRFVTLKSNFLDEEGQIKALDNGVEKIKTHFKDLSQQSYFREGKWVQKDSIFLNINTLDIIEDLIFDYSGDMLTDSMTVSTRLNGKLITKKYKVEKIGDNRFSLRVNIMSDFSFIDQYTKGKNHIKSHMTTFNIYPEDGVVIKKITATFINKKAPDQVFIKDSNLTAERYFKYKLNVL